MKHILVGSTGFVGSNLLRTAVPAFDAAYHRTDIQEAYGTHPGLLVYAGVTAAKFLANKDEAADLAVVRAAAENIERIAPRRLVLISTIDVLPPEARVGADETAAIDLAACDAYGRNRRKLELWAMEHVPGTLVVRLPALFGPGLKKNFLFDLLHPVPTMLAAAKYEELAQDPAIRDAYALQPNGFYACRLPLAGRDVLLPHFERAGFTALAFTDHRSTYQFYGLHHLWTDIEKALAADIPLLHLAMEPVSAGETYQYIYRGTKPPFTNELPKTPARYDYRTRYAATGYFQSKEQVLAEIAAFLHTAASLSEGGGPRSGGGSSKVLEPDKNAGSAKVLGEVSQ